LNPSVTADATLKNWVFTCSHNGGLLAGVVPAETMMAEQ
jgi:hypothetical protein